MNNKDYAIVAFGSQFFGLFLLIVGMITNFNSKNGYLWGDPFLTVFYLVGVTLLIFGFPAYILAILTGDIKT